MKQNKQTNKQTKHWTENLYCKPVCVCVNPNRCKYSQREIHPFLFCFVYIDKQTNKQQTLFVKCHDDVDDDDDDDGKIEKKEKKQTWFGFFSENNLFPF